MKPSKWLILTVAATLTAGGLIAFKAHAAERTTEPRAWRANLRERIKEKLGLTEDQAGQIKTALAAEKDSIKELLAKLHQARVSLREAIQAPNADEASVRVASAKVATVQADLAVLRLKLYGKLNPILTSDQRDKVQQFQQRIDDFLDNALDRLGQRLNKE
jgi:Spy/CpxP family protein refolding chaperone